MIKNKIVIIICSLIFLSLLFVFKQSLYKIYIYVFEKSVIIKNYNELGQLDGEFVSYVNGKIYAKAHFKNGLKDGWVDTYFENGQLKNRRFYVLNQAEGLEEEFYRNGSLNYNAIWKNNKRYGSNYHYATTKKLVNYDTFDLDNLFFYMEFNDSEIYTKILGNIISPNMFSVDSKSGAMVMLKDKMSYQNVKDLYIVIATPPKLTVQFDLKINDVKITGIQIINNTIKVSNAFDKEGVFNIHLTAKLLDEKKNIVKNDSLITNVTKESTARGTLN